MHTSLLCVLSLCSRIWGLCDGSLKHSADAFDRNDVSSKFYVMLLHFVALVTFYIILPSPSINFPESQSFHYFGAIFTYMILIWGNTFFLYKMIWIIVSSYWFIHNLWLTKLSRTFGDETKSIRPIEWGLRKVISVTKSFWGNTQNLDGIFIDTTLLSPLYNR